MIDARPDDARLRGIMLVLLSTFFIVLLAASTKLAGQSYPINQVIWARFFFNLLFIVLVFPRRVPRLLRTNHPWYQIARSLLIGIAGVLFVLALRHVAIADMVAITFISPILMTASAGLLLGERVAWQSWVAVGVAFVGMLFIIRPGFVEVHWAMLLPVLLALTYVANQIILRIIGHHEHPITSLAYGILIGTVVSTLALPFGWRTPDLAGWLILAAAGVSAGLGHLCLIRAYERAAVSALAPFLYSELIWATVVGFALFGDLPGSWTVVGAAIIAASGLYILQRERRRRSAGATAGPAPP